MATKLFTIGFTKKTASRFFGLLRDAGVRRVVDTRLNRGSQLAGFSKEQDLPFFLEQICNAKYEKLPILAPTGEMLKAYKKKQMSWEEYAAKFQSLIGERKIENALSRDTMDHACLLCSEDKPHKCHRRLVAEYLSEKWGGVEIVHL